MPVNSYECLFLLDPTKTSTDLEGTTNQLKATLEKYGAEILVSRKWDDRKLSYPIGGHKKGYYHLAYFKADAKNITNIDHDFRVNMKELILRHMITVVDPKWEEEMLAVAKDEQRFGLQLMHEEAPEGGGLDIGVPIPDLSGDGDDMGGRRHRPRRNPEAEVGKE